MNNNIKKTLICYIILFAFIFACFAGVLFSINRVKAEELEYTGVLEDLQKDKNFNPLDYKTYKYSELVTSSFKEVNIIQVGEGNNNELFIYTYEPTRREEPFEVLSVTMCDDAITNSVFPAGSLKDYELELISAEDLFVKYKVKNYTVSSERERYYNITQFMRAYNSDLDGELNSSLLDQKISIAVGVRFLFYYENDVLKTEAETIQLVELKTAFADFLEITKGFTFGNLVGIFDYNLLHIFVFELEGFVPDIVHDVDITYKSRAMMWKALSQEYEPQEGSVEKIIENKSIFSSDYVTVVGTGLFGKTYSWLSILNATEFKNSLKEENFTLREDLSSKLDSSNAWVILYDVTKLQKIYSGLGYYIHSGTINYDVGLLRIHFSQGINTYNLGVVSDRLTADLIAGGMGGHITKDDLQELFDKLLMILGLIGLVLILVFLSPVIWPGIKALFKWLWEFIVAVFSLIFDGIVFLVTWPVELIKKLLK